ncbi:hypothetical protein Salat_0696500 [Sesamum alatum]|uniref:Retroviral polymerase SH3-like domain-containing protein n=1 Tax=Sesamum alatum TaxID=300844 RepID=A0AAE1YSQ4_9LAMI|nr:hypothetical protein Salat_0696500 [Sesamum alatum]
MLGTAQQKNFFWSRTKIIDDPMARWTVNVVLHTWPIPKEGTLGAKRRTQELMKLYHMNTKKDHNGKDPPDQKRTKLDDKSARYVFIGYDQSPKGYKLYNPSSEKIVISRDVEFDEEDIWEWNDQNKNDRYSPFFDDEEKYMAQLVTPPSTPPPQNIQADEPESHFPVASSNLFVVRKSQALIELHLPKKSRKKNKKMEIAAWWYFLFWATIGVVSSRLGFNALDKTDLSNSMSPLILSLLKHSLAISACYSSIHAFLFSAPLKPISKFAVLIYVIIWITVYYPVGSLPLLSFLVFTWFNFMNLVFVIFNSDLPSAGTGGSELKSIFIVHLAVGSSMVLVGDQKKFFCCAVPSIALLLSVSCLATSESETFRKLLALAARANDALSRLKERIGEFIEFAVGMVGTILFQHFFGLTSFNHVIAFLYFSVTWLANLALVRPSGDLGVFGFLLSNVIVGCTVSQFGLRGTTWLVYGASLLLFGLRVKIHTLPLVVNGREHHVIVL